MTSIFTTIAADVETDAEAVLAKLEVFFTADVWPIVEAVFTYIEQNGGQDLLTIASNALSAAMSGLTTGTAPESVATAVVGTVIDEAKSAGIQIAEGAASLAVSMAAAAVNSAASASTSAPPPASTAAPAPTPAS